MGPYAYKGNQWVSFDDKAIIRQKAQYMRRLGIGGGMVWALDLDDFTDHCDEGVNPLLTELQSVLSDPSSEMDSSPETMSTADTSQNIDSEIIEETPNSSVPMTENEDFSTNAELSSDSDGATDYKVVCYCEYSYQ